jgi:hypothetical protein
MRGRIIAGLFLCCFFALSLSLLVEMLNSRHFRKGRFGRWNLLKIYPEKSGLAPGYLDDHWMRIREEAKREGEVLSYHRIVETVLVPPGAKSGNTIVLLTEYKNMAAFLGREKLFASIRQRLPSSTPGVVRQRQEDLYEPIDARMFMEVLDDGETDRFKAIPAKQ